MNLTHIRIAWRTMRKSRSFVLLNIMGLSVGIAVVMLIGLWMHDELTFDQYHRNYSSIGQMMVVQNRNETTAAHEMVAAPLAVELRSQYGADFNKVALALPKSYTLLQAGEKKLSRSGTWAEPDFPEMFSLKMIRGNYASLRDVTSVFISASAAKALFGDADPIAQTLRLNNKFDASVTGVYEDLPSNTSFANTDFIGTWAGFNSMDSISEEDKNEWSMHSYLCFVQLNNPAAFDQLTDKVKNIPARHLKAADYGTETLLVNPMKNWYLRSEYKNGSMSTGRIQFVWLFGIIGGFVLLLACINFMNLSTARSEKRAREVGVRKAIGSMRTQLIVQFLSESVLLAFISLIIAVLLVTGSIGGFNQLAAKQLTIPWNEPWFWIIAIGFTVITGLLAGSYPAFYLSSFNPVKVLKGTFRTGRFAAVPRKVLVVLQFTVSIVLIIGTIVVLQQIRHARNRPIGFERDGLIQIAVNTPELRGHYNTLRNDLLQTGVVADMCESSSPVTNLWASQIGFSWAGMDPNTVPVLGTTAITHDFGNTVQWKLVHGRNFSRDFPTDSSGMVLNESAVKLTGFKDPVGQHISFQGKKYQVIGVIKDIITTSPFKPVEPSIYFLDYGWADIITIRLKPETGIRTALTAIEKIFRQHNPASPFEYGFVDNVHAAKFAAEEKISKLAGLFAALAIFISCLGISGLASFVAEQRVKEIGVRKVLGASVFGIWHLLSKDFLWLVFIAFVLSAPIAWICMNNWLHKYEYRTGIGWWIFAASFGGALVITLVTVSAQSIRAALANPVRSLKTE